jgi:Flp pilus assembly pilin Flp
MRPVRSRLFLMTQMLKVLTRLAADEQGQDLIEYALLTGAIGFCGVVGFELFGGAISAAYSSWTAGTNDLWQVPDPKG